MPFSSATDLYTEIENHLARPDLAAFIPDFVTLGENYLNYGTENSPALRCREMEVVEDLTPTNGVCTLPDDYLEYRRVTEKTSQRRPLSFITADQAEIRYPSRSAGCGEHFTIIGSGLYTFPLTSNDIELVYYQALPPLASNTSNWLLAKAPGVYLRAALIQAYAFDRNNEELVKQAEMASSLIAGMNRTDMLGKYARASLMPRGVTP